MEHGQFGLAGSIAFLRGRSPFEIEPPSAAWARELHGFGWLRNLDAAGSDEARETGRQLALEWAIRFGAAIAASLRSRRSPRAGSSPGCRTPTCCSKTPTRRPYGRDHRQPRHAARAAFRLLARGARRLSAPAGVDGAVRSRRCRSPGTIGKSRISRATSPSELAWQMLADGGHVTRNPGLLVELLLDLLPLSQCFTARDRKLPRAAGRSAGAHAADAALSAARRRHARALQRRELRAGGRACHRARLR